MYRGFGLRSYRDLLYEFGCKDVETRELGLG